MKMPFLLFLTGILVCSCFSDASKRKMEAENLVLNQCYHVNLVLEKHFGMKIPEDLYVTYCGCVSEVLSDEMSVKYSMQELHRFKEQQKKLKAEIRRLMFYKKSLIIRECLKNL